MEQSCFGSGMFKIDCEFIYPISNAGKQTQGFRPDKPSASGVKPSLTTAATFITVFQE
jgi:hypothetical protein